MPTNLLSLICTSIVVISFQFSRFVLHTRCKNKNLFSLVSFFQFIRFISLRFVTFRVGFFFFIFLSHSFSWFFLYFYLVRILVFLFISLFCGDLLFLFLLFFFFNCELKYFIHNLSNAVYTLAYEQ